MNGPKNTIGHHLWMFPYCFCSYPLAPHLISNKTAQPIFYVDLKLPSRISMAKFKGTYVIMTHANIIRK